MASNEALPAPTAPKKPDWLCPGYPKLEADVGTASVAGQLVHYPQVVRRDVDPPIAGQTYSLVSMQIFSSPQKLSNGDMCYGFMKLRGSHPDESSAIDDAHRIIREVDSKFQVKIAPTGRWLPITQKSSFTKETIDVRESTDEVHLQDLAMKERAARNRQMAREIREREEELKNGGDIYDDPQSLTFYAMKRTTERVLRDHIDRQRKAVESSEASHRETVLILRRLERKFPGYKDQWVERYNEERRKAGITDFILSERDEQAYRNSFTFTEEELGKEDVAVTADEEEEVSV